MPRFTILNIVYATVIVALSSRLAMLVAWDALSTYIVAMSATGVGIGLWCGLTGGPASSPHRKRVAAC